MNAILGTAGHIDHGKTTLVRALTGIDCDRLEEEKKRGITIELGFAWLDLPDGARVGIVDVPGHERFIKNMVAGAAGVDCVLLTVAANEGVMPQTREHVEICSLLGARSGVVALTKIDTVDEELAQLAQEEVQDALAGTFLAQAPIVPVSSATGQGLDSLRAAIGRLLAELSPRSGTDIFRLPVDRVFSLKGFGTVVTGTIVSGQCARGELLRAYPGDKLSRARSLQAHNEAVEEARAGQRCAINLQDLEVADIERGDVMGKPGELFPSRRWFIQLHCLKSSPLPIRQRMEAHFHHGARECLAKIILTDRDVLEPGQSALAEARFPAPLAAVYGDHCVLRAHSPLRAIGGGIVVCPLPPPLRRRDRDYPEKMALLRELGQTEAANPALPAPMPPQQRARLCLDLYAAPGVDFARLRVLTGLAREPLAQALRSLAESGQSICWDEAAGGWIGAPAMEACLQKCRKRLEELHAADPYKPGFAPSALFNGWGDHLPAKFTQAALRLGVQRGLFTQEGAGLRLATHKTRLGRQDAEIIKTLLERVRADAFAPPFIRALLEEYGWDAKKTQSLLKYLLATGQIVKIQDDLYYGKEEFQRLLAALREWFANHEELEVGDLKTILGITRKHAIAVLEYLDAERVTSRVGNKRRLRKS